MVNFQEAHSVKEGPELMLGVEKHLLPSQQGASSG
jgi:hypothetical protein